MSSDLPNPSSQPARKPADSTEDPVADSAGGTADETVRGDADGIVRTDKDETVRVDADENVSADTDGAARTDVDETVRGDADGIVRTGADETVRVDTDETVRLDTDTVRPAAPNQPGTDEDRTVKSSTRASTDPEPVDPGAPPSPAGTRSSVLRAVVTSVAAVWLVAAVVAAAWFGTGWVRAMWFTDGPRGDARDSALDAARQAAINLNSMNPDNVDASISTMGSSMTGDMLNEFKQNHDRIKDAAVKSKTKLEPEILGAALDSLNSERDHASAIVVLKLTQTAPEVPVQSFRATWTLDMKKDGDTWKAEQASSLGKLVSLNTPGPAGAAPPPANGDQAAPPSAPANPSEAPAPKPGS